MKIWVEYSLRKQNYLELNGIYPIQERKGVCYYIKTKKLKCLLERYYIENAIIGGKNK